MLENFSALRLQPPGTLQQQLHLGVDCANTFTVAAVRRAGRDAAFTAHLDRTYADDVGADRTGTRVLSRRPHRAGRVGETLLHHGVAVAGKPLQRLPIENNDLVIFHVEHVQVLQRLGDGCQLLLLRAERPGQRRRVHLQAPPSDAIARDQQPAAISLLQRVQAVAGRQLHRQLDEGAGEPLDHFGKRTAARQLTLEDRERQVLRVAVGDLQERSLEGGVASDGGEPDYPFSADRRDLDSPAVFHLASNRTEPGAREIHARLAALPELVAIGDMNTSQVGQNSPVVGGRQRAEQFVGRSGSHACAQCSSLSKRDLVVL